MNPDHQIGPKVSLIEFVGGSRITQRSRARHVGLCIQSTELLLSACTSIILLCTAVRFPRRHRGAQSSSRLQARPSDLARPHRHVRRRFRSIPPIILRAVQVQLAIEEKHLPHQQSPVSQHWAAACTWYDPSSPGTPTTLFETRFAAPLYQSPLLFPREASRQLDGTYLHLCTQ